MGIEYMSHVWKKEMDVKGTRLLLLLAYADHATDDGSCYPGNGSVARKIRGSISHVKSLSRDLASAHKIIKIRDKGKETPRGKTSLTIVVAPGINCTDYADLCTKWDVLPLAYKALPADNRGGANESNDSVGVSNTVPVPNSVPESSLRDKDLESFDTNVSHDSPAKKKVNPWNAFVAEYCDLLKIEFDTGNKGKIESNAKRLYKRGKGYTVADLGAFGLWWSDETINGWRNGSAPAIHNVNTDIKQAVEWAALQHRAQSRTIKDNIELLEGNA